jgi:pilus assembly protein CpaB
VTKTILQNILVLSAGKTLQTDASGKPVDAPNVTLLVTPQQAELLTLAGNEGRIQLVLRNGGDQNIEKTAGLSLAAIYGRHARMQALDDESAVEYEEGSDPLNPRRRSSARAQAAALPPPPPPPPPAPVPDQIITIRGVDKKVETLQTMKSVQDTGRNP